MLELTIAQQAVLHQLRYGQPQTVSHLLMKLPSEVFNLLATTYPGLEWMGFHSEVITPLLQTGYIAETQIVYGKRLINRLVITAKGLAWLADS